MTVSSWYVIAGSGASAGNTSGGHCATSAVPAAPAAATCAMEAPALAVAVPAGSTAVAVAPTPSGSAETAGQVVPALFGTTASPRTSVTSSGWLAFAAAA